jgi:hypothetical protein
MEYSGFQVSYHNIKRVRKESIAGQCVTLVTKRIKEKKKRNYISGKEHTNSVAEDQSSLEDGKCENRFI